MKNIKPIPFTTIQGEFLIVAMEDDKNLYTPELYRLLVKENLVVISFIKNITENMALNILADNLYHPLYSPEQYKKSFDVLMIALDVYTENLVQGKEERVHNWVLLKKI